jgi:MoxR-like ATPase
VTRRDVTTASRTAGRVLDEVERAVLGKRPVLELVLAGVLAGGHVLLEDLPGVGKTLAARSFAAALGLDFGRVQFTPDLLPGDITGSHLYDQRTGTFQFRAGPVFTQLLLADEVNRTPPKTQAALLEAMAEGQVTVEGETRALPQPFVVLATDNPIEFEGTYPLPEAQLDRFLLRVSLGYPTEEDESRLLAERVARRTEAVRLSAVTDAAGVLSMRAAVESVHVEASLLDYVVALVTATRQHPQALVGASPRGSLAVTQLSRARALLQGRDHVLPDDVQAVAVPALAHRLVLRPELWAQSARPERVVEEVLRTVPTPGTAPFDADPVG